MNNKHNDLDDSCRQEDCTYCLKLTKTLNPLKAGEGQYTPRIVSTHTSEGLSVVRISVGLSSPDFFEGKLLLSESESEPDSESLSLFTKARSNISLRKQWIHQMFLTTAQWGG